MSDLDKLQEVVQKGVEISNEVQSAVKQLDSIDTKQFAPLVGVSLNTNTNIWFKIERFVTTYVLVFLGGLQSGLDYKKAGILALISLVRELKSYFTQPGK